MLCTEVVLFLYFAQILTYVFLVQRSFYLLLFVFKGCSEYFVLMFFFLLICFVQG